uniref:Uncharacterized protein n=1 Tax=Arundo donax TaxID=35708 RepID=A0A0A9ADX5_ARUDO
MKVKWRIGESSVMAPNHGHILLIKLVIVSISVTCYLDVSIR